jgi:hypothetical protein
LWRRCARQRLGHPEIGDVLRAGPFGRIDAPIDLDRGGGRGEPCNGNGKGEGRG